MAESPRIRGLRQKAAEPPLQVIRSDFCARGSGRFPDPGIVDSQDANRFRESGSSSICETKQE